MTLVPVALRCITTFLISLYAQIHKELDSAHSNGGGYFGISRVCQMGVSRSAQTVGQRGCVVHHTVADICATAVYVLQD